MSEKQNALDKISEATFYIKLMDHLELSKIPLTDSFDFQTEYSYLLSGILNACYSACEFLKQNKLYKDVVKDFVYKNQFFYGSGPNGGLRTVSTHFRPVKPTTFGYLPPPANNVILRFREKSQPIDSHNIVLDFTNSSFYLSNDKPQNSLNDQCAMHINELRNLIKQLT